MRGSCVRVGVCAEGVCAEGVCGGACVGVCRCGRGGRVCGGSARGQVRVWRVCVRREGAEVRRVRRVRVRMCQGQRGCEGHVC